jgi:hypothetical protein
MQRFKSSLQGSGLFLRPLIHLRSLPSQPTPAGSWCLSGDQVGRLRCLAPGDAHPKRSIAGTARRFSASRHPCQVNVTMPHGPANRPTPLPCTRTVRLLTR